MANMRETNGLAGGRALSNLPGFVCAALLATFAGSPVGLAQDAMSPDAAAAGNVQVDENLIVELHVNDEDLSNVLQMLSIQAQKNIVTSRSVSATVTANLYGVTFYEALDAILHVNGYGYIEKGNFIFVYTVEELEQIEQASRQLVAKVRKLNYLNAVDAAEFVTPLLSERGQIKTNGKTEDFPTGGTGPVGADQFANEATLVIMDYEENVAEIERLLQELDTRPAQVLVESTILQVTLNESNAFGIDFSIIGDLNFADFGGLGGPLQSVNGLIRGEGSQVTNGGSTTVPVPGPDGRGGGAASNVANLNGPSTFKAGIVYDDIAVFLRMLDEVTDTTIISKPKILTLNRQPARVLVGRKVGYLSTTSTDTSTTQTVEFLDTGTQLYFRPFVTNDGLIRMELKPQVSEASIRDANDATGAAVTIPDEVTNELTANVMVRDGNTIVLGGLFRESTTATRRQVPVLGDIPIVGAAFRGHDDASKREEIIFMITPSIIADQALAEMGERAADYVDYSRAGAREGLLIWSRERQSNQLLVEAQRLSREGKNDLALKKVQRSLALYPQSPDAVKMREKLLRERTTWHNRSLLDDTIHNDITKAMSDSGSAAKANPNSGFTGVNPNNATASATNQNSNTNSSSTVNTNSTANAAQPEPSFNDEPVEQQDDAAYAEVNESPEISQSSDVGEFFEAPSDTVVEVVVDEDQGEFAQVSDEPAWSEEQFESFSDTSLADVHETNGSFEQDWSGQESGDGFEGERTIVSNNETASPARSAFEPANLAELAAASNASGSTTNTTPNSTPSGTASSSPTLSATNASASTNASSTTRGSGFAESMVGQNRTSTFENALNQALSRELSEQKNATPGNTVNSTNTTPTSQQASTAGLPASERRVVRIGSAFNAVWSFFVPVERAITDPAPVFTSVPESNDNGAE
ncbi:MAG: secretin N-terminal domain-containing protein [Phycisphaerales bacterium]|jgi:type IV pilus assembly protein PilQ|nr:secretin N-terminal domain-containing protein [Phycisphaerales bacterium]